MQELEERQALKWLLSAGRPGGSGWLGEGLPQKPSLQRRMLAGGLHRVAFQALIERHPRKKQTQSHANALGQGAFWHVAGHQHEAPLNDCEAACCKEVSSLHVYTGFRHGNML